MKQTCRRTAVPAGEYTVTVTKTGTEGARQEKTPEGRPVSIDGKTFGYVDTKYSADKTSPLSISVSDKMVEETFEVGKPVHVFLGNVP